MAGDSPSAGDGDPHALVLPNLEGSPGTLNPELRLQTPPLSLPKALEDVCMFLHEVNVLSIFFK